jgi:signal transduction histidine kinase
VKRTHAEWTDHTMRIMAAFRWSEGMAAGLRVTDAVLALLMLAAAVVSTLEMRPREGPLTLTLSVAVVMSLALAWRTRAPILSLAVVLLASEGQAVLARPPGSLWSFAVLLLSTYSVARHRSEGWAAAGGALVIGVLWLQEWQDGASDYVFIVLVFGGVWLLGRALCRWEERATIAEENQALLARNAVTEERVRIAREMHDIVAHGIGVIAVQANAAEAALGSNPELARQPLLTIKQSSREALEEMRRLLSLLRTEDDPQPRPQPGLADLEQLVGSMRDAGLPVTVDIRGTPVHLAPGVDLSAYRIIQEALTNALKHGGAVTTSVQIEYRPQDLSIVVLSTLPESVASAPRSGVGTGTGHGLVGIRERVGSVGGELVVGPEQGRQYGVRVRLPYGEPR